MRLPLFLLLLAASAVRAEEASAPHWIWPREAPRADDNRLPRPLVMRRTFTLERAAPAATLKIAADFCRAEVTLNGQLLTVVEPYSQTVEVDATRAIKLGKNELAVEVAAVPGPAAIALTLTCTMAEGPPVLIQSDESWLLGQGADAPRSPGQVASSGQVVPELWGIGRRSIAIDSFENYEQWRQSVSSDKSQPKPPRFWTAPGFEIQTLRTAQPGEGSWIAMAFDPQGRLTVSREDQGLLRFTLDKERTKVERVETINKDLKECRGLVYDDRVLYANANNSKGLYQLMNAEGDETLQSVRLLREFPGGVGHGRNDLMLRRHFVIGINGDSVDIPVAKQTLDVVDLTSPLREARRNQKTSEGWVLGLRHPATAIVLAAGLRNPYGIDQNAYDAAFTYDADAEHDMGTPWYRPTRIAQIVPGADYGWRGVTGKWPPYYPDHPDNCPPLLDIGRGSPTAVAFGTGAKFPPEYQRALFALDWAYGRVLAIHMAPRGAGYRAGAETFLQGRPLNVTDLAIGPDGAMYLLTGGRNTQSSLYRIAYNGRIENPAPLTPHEWACDSLGFKTRDLHCRLQESGLYTPPNSSFVGTRGLIGRLLGFQPSDENAPVRADQQLGNPDPLLAYTTRLALEYQRDLSWQKEVLTAQDTATLLNAGLAVARTHDKAATAELLDCVVTLDAAKLAVGQLLSLIQIYAICREHTPEEAAARRERILAQLDPLFPLPPRLALAVSPLGTGVQAQRELARALVELNAPGIVDRVAKTLLPPVADAPGSRSDAGSRPVPQEDRIHALLILRHEREGWTPATRKQYFETLRDAAGFVAGEGMPKFLAHFREEATATLTDAERRELGDLLKTEPAAEEFAPPPARPLVKAWTLEELQPLWADNERRGDAARGAVLFREALCVRCHKAGLRGPAVGPDLTYVAGRFSRRDLLASMLTPSQVVAENYRNVQVTTTDGRVLLGRVVVGGDYRSETLRIATDPLKPTAVIELSKRDIESTRESPTSPMPEGLLNTLKLEEILDLLTFLEQGK